MAQTEKKTEAQDNQDNFEDLRDLIYFLVAQRYPTIQAAANITKELQYYAKKLLDESNTIDRREFLIEVSRVEALTDLIVEIVKSDRDYNFFIWRDNTRKYLGIMSQLAAVWRVFDTTEFPERDVKAEQYLETIKAVEKELKEIVIRIIEKAYHCDDPDEYEECCDDEPDDDDTAEEEPEES